MGRKSQLKRLGKDKDERSKFPQSYRHEDVKRIEKMNRRARINAQFFRKAGPAILLEQKVAADLEKMKK